MKYEAMWSRAYEKYGAWSKCTSQYLSRNRVLTAYVYPSPAPVDPDPCRAGRMLTRHKNVGAGQRLQSVAEEQGGARRLEFCGEDPSFLDEIEIVRYRS